jgi:ABC-type ATPase involved in cell division
VLVATHDRDMIKRMARRVIHLQGGRVVEPGAARTAAGADTR